MQPDSVNGSRDTTLIESSMKNELLGAHLNAGVIVVVTVYGERYIFSLFPHLHTPLPFSAPLLISHVVSVDVKHRVYLLTYFDDCSFSLV